MNETMITLVGRVVGDPTHRRYEENKDLVRFRLHTKERRYDPDQRTWGDVNPMYFTVHCWDALGAAVRKTLRGGNRVLVQGKLHLRQYEGQDKQKLDARVDARAIGVDLMFQDITVQDTDAFESATGPVEQVAPVQLAA
ncbi:single-strand DNA-binding protein [Actinokineospora baliensis]|uniref:single-stranded DNA-binding protein n=1 Tax=Actinokineospora baliensis TaxID=547056 RepID=UPI0019582EE5|nr:single-stranded DNA-binding protein [Actinokineospora baliensis]MBM7772428.1 single-strand DNA-binding protein [Actinokineospora baliensis]